MGFHLTASGTFVRVLSLIPHAFIALRAMFVALGLSWCIFFLPYFRLHSLPLLSPLLLSVVSVGYFRVLLGFEAAWLRAFAARPREETLMGQDKRKGYRLAKRLVPDGGRCF